MHMGKADWYVSFTLHVRRHSNKQFIGHFYLQVEWQFQMGKNCGLLLDENPTYHGAQAMV